jgi:hypothetical protein
MTARNGRQRARERRAEKFGRKSLSLSFVQALRHTRTSRVTAAKLLGVTTRTIRRWLNLETPVAAELVLEEPRFAAQFASCLSVSAKKRERAERRGR